MGVADSYNKVIDSLYDNFEYLMDLCKTYSSSPTRYTGWGEFKTYIPNTKFEVSYTTPVSSMFYGIVGNTNTVVMLHDISGNNYIPGTSLFNVVTTVDVSEIPDGSISNPNLIYCSNIDNKGIALLSATYDLNQFTATDALSSFTHTTIPYDLLGADGSLVSPVLSSYIVIETTDSNRYIVKAYTLPVYYYQVTTVLSKTHELSLKDQFNLIGNIWI